MSDTNLVLTGLLLAMFMAAIDNTIVATAMGTIVSDIGGMDKIAMKGKLEKKLRNNFKNRSLSAT